MAVITPASGEGKPSLPEEEVRLSRTESFDLKVEGAPGKSYRIEVALPAAPALEKGYPVLYVLDGNARFPLLREAREALTRRGPHDDGLPLLIVGIGYPGVERFALERRTYDYTPQALGGSVDAHGGAEQFQDFIEETLKPAIAARYPVDETRLALLGHSYGALFTLYALQSCPHCFRDYIAISPSLWWNQGQLLERFQTLVQERTWCEALQGRRLLLGVGGAEQPSNSGVPGSAREKKLRQRSMVDNAIELGGLLDTQCHELATRLEVFEGESHGSVMWPAARRALEFLRDDMP